MPVVEGLQEGRLTRALAAEASLLACQTLKRELQQDCETACFAFGLARMISRHHEPQRLGLRAEIARGSFPSLRLLCFYSGTRDLQGEL